MLKESYMETKQTRKTPLTTVSISQETGKKIDEYMAKNFPGQRRTRKDFVDLAAEYFTHTGNDVEVFTIDRRSSDDLQDAIKALNAQRENNEKMIAFVSQLAANPQKLLEASSDVVDTRLQQKVDEALSHQQAEFEAQRKVADVAAQQKLDAADGRTAELLDTVKEFLNELEQANGWTKGKTRRGLVGQLIEKLKEYDRAPGD